MGRAKEFDPDVVLRAAMELFWRKGYEATSVQDLVEHLGLGKGSLYGAFGGKRELYLKAVERYAEDARQGMLDRLSGTDSPLEGVRDFVRWYARDSLADSDHKGCLLTNTAVELPGDDAAVRVVAGGLDLLETMLTSALLRARAQGELSADRDPAALARYLVTVLQGIRVVGKTSLRERLLQDAVEQALTTLA
ncbi:TetR/AcrR family transcriptional regulator [Nocardia sp. NPDC051570]|uniref:TetR/AcrR family transcriptional regulator n=1 Tax=Nocardia sp. NPDC051570 TaxID=3364324 RepID=UPI0037B1D8B1